MITRTSEQFMFYILLGVVLVGLTGCTTLNRSPQSVQESLYIAASYGEALTLSVNEAYRTRNITREQHLKALDNLSSAHVALQSGLAAYNIGDFNAAQSALDRTESVLRVVALLISQYGETQ